MNERGDLMSNHFSKVNMSNVIWKPDKGSLVPLYKQIVDFIQDKISTGEWAVGSRLPTQMELAEKFEVNRSTIVEVYDELKAEGLIDSKKSAGTIIINNTWSILASLAPPDWGKYIAKGTQQPNLNVIKIINELEPNDNMIRLGAGELSRDLYPFEYMKEVYDHLLNDITYMGYEESKGLLPLREEVCKYLKKFGIETQPSKVMIVSGALQALHLISIGILHRGSTILTEKPSYLNSLTLFESHGINLSGVQMDQNGVLPEDIIRKSSAKRPELFYTIPCFQNPTGVLTTEKRRKEILSLCERERLPILEDDTYRELWLDEKPSIPMKTIDRNGTVLYLGSISKTLSAGLRVGWIVGTESVIDRLADIKMQTDYGTSSVSQWICYEFLSKGYYDQFIQKLREKLREKRDYTLSILETHFKDIAMWGKPSGGFYLWLNFKKDLPLYRLFESCYKQGVVINPGNLYDSSNTRSIRISYAYAQPEELKKGLIILAKTIKEYL